MMTHFLELKYFQWVFVLNIDDLAWTVKRLKVQVSRRRGKRSVGEILKFKKSLHFVFSIFSIR